jgi:predicted DNA-binding transcriptional regulator AlpA
MSGATMSPSIENLPTDLARHRVLNTRQTCEFVNLSVAQWRRLRKAGEAPRGRQLGKRKQGWRLGDLIDWVDSRGPEQIAA